MAATVREPLLWTRRSLPVATFVVSQTRLLFTRPVTRLSFVRIVSTGVGRAAPISLELSTLFLWLPIAHCRQSTGARERRRSSVEARDHSPHVCDPLVSEPKSPQKMKLQPHVPTRPDLSAKLWRARVASFCSCSARL